MARGTDLQGPDRKTRERIERSLQRGDAVAAVETLMSLPAGARAQLIDGVARLLRRSAPELQRQGNWAPLHQLAARAESEPRLLGTGPAPGLAPAGPSPDGDQSLDWEQAGLLWPLLLSCLHARDWARAGRYLARLRPALAALCPALERVLAAWIERQGELDAQVLRSLALPELRQPAPDPRLGYDPPSRRRAPPPPLPQSADQVADQVLALAATQPFVTFAEIALQWQRQASPAVGGAVAVAAAPLAVREILLSLERRAPPVEPALLLGRLARAAPPGGPLAAELLSGLRLALPALARAPDERHLQAALGELAAAAGRQPEAQAYLLAWLGAGEPADRPRICWLRVAEAMVDGARLDPGEQARLWAAAVVQWNRERPGRDGPGPHPAWLQALTSRVLENPSVLGATLATLPREQRRPLLAGLVADASVLSASAILAACWDTGDEPERRELASLVSALMDRAAQIDLSDSDLLRELGSLDGRLARRLLGAIDGDGDDDGLPPLLGPARQVWRQIGQRAAAYDPDLLAQALAEAPDAASARRCVDTYLAGRSDIDARLEAIRAIGQTERDQLQRLMTDVIERMLQDFAGDPAALARGLRWARQRGAPPSLLRILAGGLLAAAARQQVGSTPPPWLEELVFAHRLAGRRGRAGGPGRPRKGKQRGGKSKARDETGGAGATAAGPAEARAEGAKGTKGAEAAKGTKGASAGQRRRARRRTAGEEPNPAAAAPPEPSGGATRAERSASAAQQLGLPLEDVSS